MEKIYIAGPDVFLRDVAKEQLEELRQLCLNYGFDGIIPFDANVDFNQSNEKIRKDIFSKNIEFIQECDIIIADLNNFRHNEPDSGTVFELGFARALNKEIYFYSEDSRTTIEKTMECDEYSVYDDITDNYYDSNDMLIEGFGSHFNIMINECGQFIIGDFETVLKEISK